MGRIVWEVTLSAALHNPLTAVWGEKMAAAHDDMSTLTEGWGYHPKTQDQRKFVPSV